MKFITERYYSKRNNFYYICNIIQHTIMALGKKLIELRNNRGLSQMQIADKLDVSQSAYNKWEK